MGFWEIVVILLVALLVLGPERLPKALHQVGRWYQKGRQMMGQVQQTLDDTLKHEELKHNQARAEEAERQNNKAESKCQNQTHQN